VDDAIEFAPRGARGRLYSATGRVRLGDADVHGLLRLDGLARHLQDVATDDWDDTGLDAQDVWVVRRTAIRRTTSRWPALGDAVTLTTWCAGTGAAWAERRTDLEVGGQTLLEAAALWVPTDPDGRPRRLRPTFFTVYGEAVGDRKVSGRVARPAVDPAARRRRWEVRRSDLDVVGHVNNAAVWSAVAEVAPEAPRAVTVVHHGALELDDEVVLAYTEHAFWLVVDGDVRVSGGFELE